MIELIIAAIVIIAILLFFIFFVFKNIIGKLNENTKKYFVEKLQTYDEIIDEKKSEIQNLDEEIKKRITKIQVISGNLLENSKEELLEGSLEQEKYDLTSNEIISTIMRNPSYREEKFFDTYRSVKKMFNLNIEKTIKEFINTYVDSSEQKDYEKLKKTLSYFDNDTTYECLTLKNTEQYDIVKSLLKKREKELLKFDEIEREKFDLNKFIESIKSKMQEIDPTIHIYVGSNDENYDYLSEYIKTEVYTKMIEGVMISYKGKIYDYSI